MKKTIFWRLFVVVGLGGVIFFSLLHSAAILSNEKMSFIAQKDQDEIVSWGKYAQTLLDQGKTDELDIWIDELSKRENTWASLVKNEFKSVAGNPIEPRFSEDFWIGRSVEWKLHLEFHVDPVMEVPLENQNYHFLIRLPRRMLPGTYMSHAFWLFRVIIPFAAFLALSVYVYRYIMRPLNIFHYAAKQVENGNYGVRISDTLNLGNNELGQVAQTFDRMASRTGEVVGHNRRLIAEMSHEIRTPITRIELASDCIEKQIDVSEMNQRIKQEIKQVRQMAEDTLTLAWLENEQPKLVGEDFDLIELVETIVEDAQFEYPNVKIHTELPEEALLTNSSQRALSQVFENILRNGLRYSLGHGNLYVQVKLTKHNVSMFIRDTGPGLEDELTNEIFKPFFKADNQIDGRKGFGVGLALAKQHVDAVNGTIYARNWRDKTNQKDSGLEFVISLPLT